MGDRSHFERVAEAHQLHIGSVVAECWCGEWSRSYATPTEVLAGWAAHVHVAAGLAEEDEQVEVLGTSAPLLAPPAWGSVESRPEEWTASERAFIEAAATGATAINPRRLHPAGRERYASPNELAEGYVCSCHA